MKIILLAGAGSVGKTQALEAVMQVAHRRGLRGAPHTSTTRRTYGDHGYTSESDAAQTPEFQRRVMQDNVEALHRRYAEAQNSRCDFLVADRSPHDYASYYTHTFSHELKIAHIDERQRTADAAVRHLMRDITTDVHVFFLPFPAPWSVDVESSDGWRNDNTGKNWGWSTQCETMLRRAELNPLQFKIERLNPFFMNGDPETRATGILSRVFPEWKE